MFGPTEAITTDLVKLALDAASMRHLAIAHNLANVNTPGFAPARVDFENQLDAARAALRGGQPLEASMLAGVRPVGTRAPVLEGSDRTAMLDMEVAAMAQNTVHYESLLKALGKQMSILASAISEGKR